MSLDLISVELDTGIVQHDAPGRDWTDLEAYRQLYVSVIQLAIKDYEFLRKINGQDSLSPSERKKLRGLTEDSDPVEFFNSRWFEDICGMIGVEPKAIREKLEVDGETSLLPVNIS